VIPWRDWMIPQLQRRYRGYFSSYLKAKIRTARSMDGAKR
jgi:hypothetical protein